MKKLGITFLLLCMTILSVQAEELAVTWAYDAGDFTLRILADAEGARYVGMQSRNVVRQSGPWPEDMVVDVSADELTLRWGQRMACYRLDTDGTWRLCFLWQPVAGDYFYECYAFFGGYDGDGFRGGTFAMGDLFDGPTGDTLFDAAQAPDRTGWARVDLHGAEGMLPLYVEPSAEADRLACFFQGTPVRVLAEQGDWRQVAIGARAQYTGWTPAPHLTTGEGMDAVESHFSPIVHPVNEALLDGAFFASATWHIGLAERDGVRMTIILNSWGDTVEYPQSWFAPGNG